MHLFKKTTLVLALASFLILGCSNDIKTIDLTSIEGADIEQLFIVDCLLPSTVRQLGTRLTYLGARRVIKTSGSECAIRGGEFVAHDRANFTTALKVWLPLAQSGDLKAQTYVGEIYEKGLGTKPDYRKAASWYQKAANKGYARAQMSLGSLYERGVGVSRDNTTALNLYRDASGLGERHVEFVSIAQRKARAAQSNQLAQTQRELQHARQGADKLQREVQQLQSEAKRIKAAPFKVEVSTVIIRNNPRQMETIRQLNREIANLKALHQKTPSQQQEITQKQNKVAKIKVAAVEQQIQKKKDALVQQEQRVSKLALRSAKPKERSVGSLSGVDFGRYYAVVIGNNNYSNVSNLRTAVNDARTVASVLKSQYGFKTIVLSNASRGKMLAVFESLRKRLTAKDNLVIYYAGHGELSRGRGFWLPSDAVKGNKKTWISNEQLTNFIDAMKAKHVLVVADSCYSGTLSQSSIPSPVTDSGRSREWFEAVARTKVRVVMSSGGVRPVLDSGGGNHSVFAGAFIQALRSGGSVIEGAGLFQALREQVKQASSARGNRQNPRYSPIRFAGHEAGDFVFLKDGRIAQVDPSPQKKDHEKGSKSLFVIREFLLALLV